MKMELLYKYNNGNTVVSIYDDGTKIRECPDGVVAKPVHPESMDIKITNSCSGNCEFCHEMSNPQGAHADLDRLLDVLKILPAGTEVACLEGDTMVHSERGSRPISQLKIGDKIYDSTNQLRVVTNITVSKKQSINIKGNKGFRVTASKDHPFMVDNKMVMAEDLLESKLDLLESVILKSKKKYTYDLSEFITQPSRDPSGYRGSRGGKFTEDKVRLNHCSGWCDRYITLDNDLMWMYGLTVAEGSYKSLCLHKDETEIANRFIQKYKSLFDRDCNIFIHKNSQTIEPLDSFLYKTLFFRLMNVGHLAHNKNLSFLYSINDKELIRSALYGLYEGDGCFRKRLNKNTYRFNLSLKTCSRFLAYDVLFLLNKHFNIRASIHKGMNKVRKIEGRTLKESVYYKVDIYNKNDILKLFPNVFANDNDFEKLGTYKYSANTTIEDLTINSIEESIVQDLYDITLDDSSTHIFPINGYVLTHNCGGGAAQSHPELIPFLNALKNQGLIANMTINQKHFRKDKDIITKIVSEKLIRGIGVSYSDPKYLTDIEPVINLTNDMVFHVIMGINSVEVIDELQSFCDKNNKPCKVLVLGYKTYGLGKPYYELNKESIEENKLQWYRRLALKFKEPNLTLSFDNLAIKQLNLKRFFTDKAWNKFWMGKEGSHTSYLDAVKQEYAICSIDPNRVSWNDTDLFSFFQNIKAQDY